MGKNDTDKLQPVIAKWNAAHPDEQVSLKELPGEVRATRIPGRTGSERPSCGYGSGAPGGRCRDVRLGVADIWVNYVGIARDASMRVARRGDPGEFIEDAGSAVGSAAKGSARFAPTFYCIVKNADVAAPLAGTRTGMPRRDPYSNSDRGLVKRTRQGWRRVEPMTDTMPARRVYADEIAVGSTYELSAYTVTEDDVVTFAEQWDPQWFHTDAGAAEHGPYKGLIACGMHTLAIYQRLSVVDVFENWHVIAGRRLRDVRFLRPLRPGTTVTGRLRITGLDHDRPGRALLVAQGELVGDNGKQLLTAATEIYVRARA